MPAAAEFGRPVVLLATTFAGSARQDPWVARAHFSLGDVQSDFGTLHLGFQLAEPLQLDCAAACVSSASPTSFFNSRRCSSSVASS